MVGGYLFDHYGYEFIFLPTSLVSILFGVGTFCKFRNYRPGALRREESGSQTEEEAEVDFPITHFLKRPRYYIAFLLYMMNTGQWGFLDPIFGPYIKATYNLTVH